MPQADLLYLTYRPPYAWETLRDFLDRRHLAGLEWVGDDHYGRCVIWQGVHGRFTARHEPEQHRFAVQVELDDLQALAPVVTQIRRMLDLDADTAAIEAHLTQAVPGLPLIEGLRLPNVWSLFEAGVRAILGQQVSVAAAHRLATTLVERLGDPAPDSRRHFPGPERVAQSDLLFLGMPGARRDTLRRFAQWYASADNSQDTEAWTALKGIGPWTAHYAAMRGGGHPDIWLGGDLGIKKALATLGGADPATASPWRSYLTLQLWSRSSLPQEPPT